MYPRRLVTLSGECDDSRRDSENCRHPRPSRRPRPRRNRTRRRLRSASSLSRHDLTLRRRDQGATRTARPSCDPRRRQRRQRRNQRRSNGFDDGARRSRGRNRHRRAADSAIRPGGRKGLGDRDRGRFDGCAAGEEALGDDLGAGVARAARDSLAGRWVGTSAIDRDADFVGFGDVVYDCLDGVAGGSWIGVGERCAAYEIRLG